MVDPAPPRSTPKPLIVVVEDEPELANLIAQYLERAEMRVQVCNRAAHAMKFLQRNFANLVLLDLTLPDQPGFALYTDMKSENINVPVIFLTANVEEASKVHGFDLGADDYITKPFSLRELAARVRAVLRRSVSKEDRPAAGTYQDAHLTADFDAVAVTVDGSSIRLTRREFELLRYLVQNKNRVISRDRLLERVWGYDRLIETRSVDVHVGRLRSKLRVAGRQIETVVGLGYRFVDEHKA